MEEQRNLEEMDRIRRDKAALEATKQLFCVSIVNV